MFRAKKPIFRWTLLLFLLLACRGGAPSDEQLQTAAAETQAVQLTEAAGAAQTQTALAPTAAPTSTLSPLPTETPTPAPTQTLVPTDPPQPTAPPAATDAPEVTADPSETSAPLPEAGQIIFEDDFSSPNSGWEDTYRDETGMTDYDQGGFRIQVLLPQFDYWANPGLNLADVSIEVEATKIGGPEDNDFGVICRYQDPDNFYFLLATSDGFYAVGKYSGGVQSLFGSDFFEPTDTVNSGNTTNLIRADCVGDSLTLYINGIQVHQATDSDHSSGDVGLMAGTFDEPGTDILFDNFIVRQP